MPNIIPILTSIEASWKPEIVQRPDVDEVSGQLRDVTRQVTLQQELSIRFDWFEVGGQEPLFYRQFSWLADKQPATTDGLLGERVAASDLIGKDSEFAIIAAKLYELAGSALAPAQADLAFAMKTFVTNNPVGRMKIHLPYAQRNAAERSIEIDVHHYLDKDFKQVAFKKTQQWLSRAVIEQRNLEGETACEALLNQPNLEPLLMSTIKKCGELVQGVYPTFSVDLDEWITLAQGIVDAFNPE